MKAWIGPFGMPENRLRHQDASIYPSVSVSFAAGSRPLKKVDDLSINPVSHQAG